MYNSDEAEKMAMTDALSVAMKAIGVAGDIYLGIDSYSPKESIEQAIKDKIENAKSLEELTQIYNTYNSKTKDQKEFIKLMASKKEKLKNENS
jgi:hypothetical protein